jgi:methylglutaconyl-CoA hydratase
MTDYIRQEKAGDVLRVTLARPDVRNAFDAELIRQLTQALKTAAKDETLRMLVLGADGPVFCAGADFHWMSSLQQADRTANIADAQRLFDMFHALYTFPCPTIARVQGGAYGGGSGLIACCDIAVLADDATLAFSEVKIGLVPATISPFVIRKIGAGYTREVFLTGVPIPAKRALEIGLANAVVTANDLDSTVNGYIKTIQTAGPKATRATKLLIHDVALMKMADARTYTAELIAEQRVSPEGQEGMAAFLEKRKPTWNP